MSDLIGLLFFCVAIWFFWQSFVNKPKPNALTQQPTKEDKEAQYLKSTLDFAKEQHKALKKKQNERNAWQQSYGNAKASELDKLSGTEFENFLAGLYRAQGYTVELTANTGDYGADLMLTKNQERISVQAKRYTGSVGVAAVQEALSGKAYYQCSAAWVITTGTFTANAIKLAKKSDVKMISRSELGNLLAQHQNKHT